MDQLTFISKTIEALAWPTVTLVLGLVFRRKLLDLIPAIRKLKAGPVEAEFELAAKQVLADAAVASAHGATSAIKVRPETEASSGTELVAKLISARNDPIGMILEGWAKVDGELFQLGAQMGLSVGPLDNTNKIYQSVMTMGILPAETKRLICELRELRNKVAHVKVAPTADAAQDYLLAVDRVVELIFNYRKNLTNYRPSNRHPSPVESEGQT